MTSLTDGATQSDENSTQPEREIELLLVTAARGIRSMQTSILHQGCRAIAQSDQHLLAVQSGLMQATFLLKRYPGLHKSGLRELADELQREVQQLVDMLDEAMQFYSVWLDQLNVSVSGYSPDGGAAQHVSHQRLSIES